MMNSDKINKENFRLLDLSSEEQSDDLELNIIQSRKKKMTRRDRSRGGQIKHTEVNFETELQCAVRWAMRGTLLLWLLMLTWLCASLYDQVSSISQRIRLDISKVSTSSDSVGDALQVCHTAAKELRANASELSIRLNSLEQQHLDLVKKVEGVKQELSTVSTQLGAAPLLGEMPRRVNELQRTLADVGSQIRGFDGNLNTVRKQAVAAVATAEDLKTMLHTLEARTNDTIANLTQNMRKEDQLQVQLDVWNITIMQRFGQLQAKLDELTKLQQTTLPPPPATTSTSTSSSTTTSTSTTTPPPSPSTPGTNQVVPAKPGILTGVQ